MKRWLLPILILSVPAIVLANWMYLPGPGYSVNTGSSPQSCAGTSTIYYDNHDGGSNIGASSTDYYGGIINNSATAIDVCSISYYIRQNGSLSGYTLYVELWNYNSTTAALTSKISTLASIDASTIPTSIGYVNFNTGILLQQNQAIILTFNEITGPSNNMTIAYISSNTIPNQSFRIWKSDLTQAGGSGDSWDMRGYIYGTN